MHGHLSRAANARKDVSDQPGPLEGVVMYSNAFTDKVVWLSGDTGFKGAWLSEWLLALGAKVHGFALSPPTSPALFDQLGLGREVEHETGDVRDFDQVRH